MIPKIIHYCWLSDDAMPDLVLRCINSWKENYQIMNLFFGIRNVLI